MSVTMVKHYYVATVNVPGYLPDSDEPPPVFTCAPAAWRYLQDGLERDFDMDEEVDTEGAWLEMDTNAHGHETGTVVVDIGRALPLYYNVEPFPS